MNKSIRSNINFGVFLVIIFCTVILCIVFVFFYRQSVVNYVVSKLDISLQTAWDQITINDESMKSKLREWIYANNVKLMLESEDNEYIDKLISTFDSPNDSRQFYLVTDSHGKVISSSFKEEIGKDWCFSNVLDSFDNSSNPLCTFELMPESNIEHTSQEFKNNMKLQSSNTDYGKDVPALVRLVVVPIYDHNYQLLGSVAGGFLLNNYEELANTYTSKIPNTYLSIAIDGVRIVSNISADDFIYSEGSLQEQILINTTKEGKRYQGKIKMSNADALIDIDPIYNYEGKVIGNMGVGSPTFIISELNSGDVLIIILLGVITTAFSTLVVQKINKRLANPIVELHKYARDITEKENPIQDIVWDEKEVPLELQELAQSITNMAKNLMSDKLYLEDKVKKRTTQLTETINELEKANSYKSQFLANVSHELRTPLNSIIGFASLLKDNLYGSLNEKQDLYVSTIISSGNHLMQMINDLLDIIKLDKGIITLYPKNVDLTQLFNEVSDLVFPLIKAKSQEFSINVDENIPVVIWDEQKIKQVVLNLLSNAVKFTPKSGEINLSAEMSGNSVLIKVSDTGIGVPEDMREKVFLAFEQANSSYTKLYEGVGLGLAICKNLVALHNGIIWLDENPGGGTIGYVLIPINSFESSKNKCLQPIKDKCLQPIVDNE